MLKEILCRSRFMGNRRISLILSFLMLITTAVLPGLTNAADGDGDGSDDSVDDCPFAWGNSTATLMDCPDNDGDGIADSQQDSTGDWGESGREMYQGLGGWSSTVRAVAWAPDGTYQLAGGSTNQVRVYGPAGASFGSIMSMTDDVRSIAVSPNSSYIAAAGYEGSGTSNLLVMEYEHSTGNSSIVANLSSHITGDLYTVAWSNDGNYLYSGGEDRHIRMFDVNTWQVERSFLMPESVYSVVPTPDNRLIASTNGQETSMNWTSNGTSYFALHNHTSTTLALDISPDGRWLVSGGNDNRLSVYDVKNKTLNQSIWTGSDVNAISFSPNGGYFVIGTDGSSASVYRVSDWTSIDSFGSFGGSNSRGARDIAWAPDGLKITVGQRNGAASMYVLEEGYLALKGDVTGELMLWRWKSNWPSDGRPLSHENMSLSAFTQSLCNGDDIVGVQSVGAAHHIASPLANYSDSGLLDCTSTSRSLREVPIGRMPAAFFVKGSGNAATCMQATGGMSLGQIRWILSAASTADMTTDSWRPGMDMASIAPNDDMDGIPEWSDLSSQCSGGPIHVIGRWDNRSVPTMVERMFACAGCQYAENFFTSSNSRYRMQEESRSDIVYAASSTDELLGFTEILVAQAAPGLHLVPIVNNWTAGAEDHISAGGSAFLPTVSNSENGTYAAQSDYNFIVNEAELEDRRALLEWMLSTEAGDEWEGLGFQKLGIYARVQAYARLGIDATHLLPDEDGDGIWDGADDCHGTWPGENIDSVGCAQHQLDDDGDGLFNHEDDCISVYGNSTTPTVGCPDQDGDGWEDSADAFPYDPTQQLNRDGDRYGDNLEGNNSDDCPDFSGNSTEDRLGCPDTDGDGWSDEDGDWEIGDGADAFRTDPSQWIDTDGDGYGDNHSYTIGQDGLRVDERGDAFVNDHTQWADTDGDGYGDETSGDLGDDCPLQAGNSTEDRLGCPDEDGDGYSDDADAFRGDPSQWVDEDGDGYGDNWNGLYPDNCLDTPFPELDYVDEFGCGPSERDTDMDGVKDDVDLCPSTPLDLTAFIRMNGCADAESDDDGDGVLNPVDGPEGLFRDDPTQTADSDGDGYGDNESGTNGDACPNRAGNSTEDRLGCVDTDGDGYSDPESGWTVTHGADAWVVEPTQWSDYDSDGYYDNYGEPSWSASREEGWPGRYVEGARLGDKCPLQPSESAYPDPGCPLREINAPVINTGDSDSGGLPVGLILIVLGLLFGIVGLTAAIIVKQKGKKQRKAERRRSAATSQKQQAAPNTAAGRPDASLVGAVGDDEFEWLEHPEGSDRWWYRDESGEWAEWQ